MAAGSSRFSKALRLLSRAEFDRVQNGAETRRASSPHFLVLLTARGESGAGPRLGVIASRRVGSAVRRNRAKRLIREFFRASASSLGDYDMVVVVHPGADSLTAAQAAEELASAARRAARADAQPQRRPPARTKKKGGRA